MIVHICGKLRHIWQELRNPSSAISSVDNREDLTKLKVAQDDTMQIPRTIHVRNEEHMALKTPVTKDIHALIEKVKREYTG